MIESVDERGQHRAIWNRWTPGWEDGRRCALCGDPMRDVDLINQHAVDDPYDGAQPLVLVAGEWLHVECAAGQASRTTLIATNPGWAAYFAGEQEAKAEPRPVPTWLYGPALVGSIVGLAVLRFGFVWTLPVLTVVAGFGFVLGLAVLDHLD